jgi:hypothetical protein
MITNISNGNKEITLKIERQPTYVHKSTNGRNSIQEIKCYGAISETPFLVVCLENQAQRCIQFDKLYRDGNQIKTWRALTKYFDDVSTLPITQLHAR